METKSKRTKEQIKMFNDGHTSFFTKSRICYPVNMEDEKHWLAGFYLAQREQEIQLEDLGQDTFLWKYKRG